MTTSASPVSITLPRSFPEAQGIASRDILDFLNAADDTVRHLHSFALLRHGHTIAEAWWRPFAADQPHILYSLTKSFASTAIGLAIGEGLLNLDDAVISFFPDETPADPHPNLRAMRLHHLLSMSTGHSVDPTGQLRQSDGNWARAFLAIPPDLAPGSRFVYNSAASYMLGAILHKLTGQTLKQYLTPRLFEPLGISNPLWETCPAGLSIGGWGLYLKTNEIARFGQLLVQDGQWGGRQLLPAGWVKLASQPHIMQDPNPDSDWNQGYGFQFWRCRHNAFRGDGAFGQFCIVMPDQDAVVAITAGTDKLGDVTSLVWKHLLPAMQAAPLPSDPAAEKQLRDRSAHLAIPTVAGQPTSDLLTQIADHTYCLDTNDLGLCSVRLHLNGDECHIHFEGPTASDLHAHFGHWHSQPSPDGPLAASFAFTAPDTLTCRALLYQTTFVRILTFKLTGNTLALQIDNTGGFQSTTHNLTGHATS